MADASELLQKIDANLSVVTETAPAPWWALLLRDIRPHLEAPFAEQLAALKAKLLVAPPGMYVVGAENRTCQAFRHGEEAEILRFASENRATVPEAPAPKTTFEQQLDALGAEHRYVTGTAEAPRSHTVVVTAEHGERAEYYTPRQNEEAIAFAAANRKQAATADPPQVPLEVADHADGQPHPMPEGFVEKFRQRGATVEVGMGEQGPRWIIHYADPAMVGFAAHEMGAAEWEEMLRGAELRDSRPTLAEWEGEEVAVVDWCRSQKPPWGYWFSPVGHGDRPAGILAPESSQWSIEPTWSAALAAACQAAGVCAPWSEWREAEKEVATHAS